MEINGISQFKTSEDGVSQDLVNFINSAEIPFIMSNIQERITPESAWGALQQHYEQLNRNGELQLNYLLRDDPHRAQVMSLATGQLYLDYSKNRLTTVTIDLLILLAQECGLQEKIHTMFAGGIINQSEQRAALHTALRLPIGDSIYLDKINLLPQIQQNLMQMRLLSEKIREGRMVGCTGQVIKNIINIGIGGSDLGPLMAFEALRFYSDRGLCFRFVSNIDSSDFIEAVRDLDPAECLFIVCSKSFTTPETLSNAHLARTWCMEKMHHHEMITKHFIAVSENEHGVAEFGIDISTMFILWDWVGGRYSIDSAVGLSTMIAIGSENFHDLLCGMHDMDQHFLNTPLFENMPAILGLIAIWNNNFLMASSVAVLPYSHYLQRFPAYLQQLTMESNGKHVDVNGKMITVPTCPIYWGQPGTNGQHSFYQLLHQGTPVVATDFIGFCQPLHDHMAQHDILMANCFAQTEALAFGRTLDELVRSGIAPELAIQQVCTGNRMSNTILADTLSPASLGQLIALYEHSVFTQGAIWNINSFDQWGVELGKKAAKKIAPFLIQKDQIRPDEIEQYDCSTQALMLHYRHRRDV